MPLLAGRCKTGLASCERREGSALILQSRRGWLTRAPPTRPLEELAAEAEEEEPVVESAALCVEGLEGTCWADQFLRTRRVIDSDHLSKKPTENP